MDEARFESLLREHLMRMVPGATLDGPGPLTGKWKQKVVALTGPCTISVRPTKSSTFDFTIARSQKFQRSEQDLVECFVDATADVEDALGKPFEGEVTRGLPLRVVARAAGGPSHGTMLRVLEQLSTWAAEQYEGRPITVAVGIDPDVAGSVDVTDVWKEAFAPVISNGMDTLVVVDSGGRVASLVAAPAAASPPFSPFRFGALAEWATGARVAVSLNRTGEILVFRGQCLRFALRGGVWHHFTHEAAVSAIHLPHKKAVKTALYETLLDVSFARSGGCIAVVEYAKRADVSEYVASGDFLSPPDAEPSLKGRLLSTAAGSDFTALDRRIRAELLALDGATIISNTGRIIAVGAIVRIGKGSAGGGRLAAARTLGELGLGVKISQDGTVTGFDADGAKRFEFG